MPRRHKRKVRMQDKHHSAHNDSPHHKGIHKSAEVTEGLPSSSFPVTGDTPLISSTFASKSNPQVLSILPSTTTTSGGLSEDENNQDDKHTGSSEDPASTECGHFLDKKVDLLEQFLLHKYRMKQPITKEDMLKTVNHVCQYHFAEILKRASDRIMTIFAVELQEVNSTTQVYDLVSKLKLPNNGRIRPGRGLPKTGLLMMLLGVILMKGNRATEEDIWEFLKMLQVYPGRNHFLYGEPRKLITQHFVRLKYLVYQQVPNCDPVRHEFLWGPQAYSETSKIKVIEFFNKVNDTLPSAFAAQYEEALRDEEKRAHGRIATTTVTTSTGRHAQ